MSTTQIANNQYYQNPNKSQSPNSKGKVYDIRERFFKFAQRVLNIGEMLPKNKVYDVLRAQLVRAGTSVGANLEEADGTLTKRDFINKIVVARKEAKETKYWLRLINSKYLEQDVIAQDIREDQELVNILSSIIIKTKTHKT